MSRPAEQLLEFDRLKEIVSGFTTCAPGRRAITCARSATRRGPARRRIHSHPRSRRLFASAAQNSDSVRSPIPNSGSRASRFPHPCFRSRELLDAASLMEIVTGVRQSFKSDAAKFPRLAERAASFADFRHLPTAIRRAILAQWRNQRRRFAAPAAHSRRHRAGARENSKVARKYSARARRDQPARITSRCATTASSFPCALRTAAQFRAWCTPRAPRARPFSSSRSKRSI